VGTSDYNEFLAVREDIYLRIIDIVQGAGTGFAYPSSTTYLARDEGLDSEKARAAEGTVEQWRREGRLMFPEFAREEIERLDGTLDFPPKGSSVGARA
jgi:MscS family membrane protein